VRELHVVAVSEDGRHVLLASRRGTTKTTYRIALDERLLAAVRGDLPRPGTETPVASELTPKEIQARLRAGESATSIAAAAGVPVTRVERFSGPVQGEMARVIDAARASYVVRGRLGRSVLTLGVAVDHALAAQPGLRPESTEWSTYREEDGTWKVTVRWFARARLRDASWVYDPAAKGPAQRQVTAVDPASAALGHAAEETHAAPKPAPKPAAKKPAAKKAAPKKAAPKQAAKKPAAKKAAPKAAAKKVAPKPAAKKVAPKPAAKPAKAVRKAAPVKALPQTAARKAPAPRPTKARALRVVPDPAPTPRQSPRKKPTAAERDGVANRAVVPGWADVLLGTTPGSDR
jgi:hypothetical protein